MIAKFLTAVNIRNTPLNSGNIIGTYYKGETVKYDNLIEIEGRLWISYARRSGMRAYCCARDEEGEWYIKLKNPAAPDCSFSLSSPYSPSFSD